MGIMSLVSFVGRVLFCVSNHVAEFVNANDAFNVTSVDLLETPVDGFNVNATISIRNPTPFIVEMVRVLVLNSSS